MKATVIDVHCTSGADQAPGGKRDSGLTMVELLIALFILGIIFSAVASALINFSRASHSTERRVQATAFLSASHEAFEGLPWDDAGIYESEVQLLSGVDGVDISDPDNPTYETWPIVVVDDPVGPDCDPANVPFSDACRGSISAPVPFSPVTVDGRDYPELVQIITWVDDLSTGEVVKRYDTILTWVVFGRSVDQRFQSYRAPTPSEVEPTVLPIVTSFLFVPNNVFLDGDRSNLEEIEISGRFSEPPDVGTVRVEIPLESGGTHEVDLAPVVGSDNRFVATLPAGSLPPLLDAAPLVTDPVEVDVKLIGDFSGFAGLEVSASKNLTLRDGTALGPAPNVTSSSATPPTVVVGRSGGDHVLCEPLTLQATVDNLDSAGFVVANSAATGAGIDLVPQPAEVSDSNHSFVRVLPAGSVSPWRPTPLTKVKGKTTNAVDVQDTFTMVATNGLTGQQGSRIANTVTFVASTANNQEC